jgi:hypothetical protein
MSVMHRLLLQDPEMGKSPTPIGSAWRLRKSPWRRSALVRIEEVGPLGQLLRRDGEPRGGAGVGSERAVPSEHHGRLGCQPGRRPNQIDGPRGIRDGADAITGRTGMSRWKPVVVRRRNPVGGAAVTHAYWQDAENPLSRRLLKKVQMQGGVTHHMGTRGGVPTAGGSRRTSGTPQRVPQRGGTHRRWVTADGPFSAAC